MKKIIGMLFAIVTSITAYEKKQACQEAHTPLTRPLLFGNTEGTYCYYNHQENDSNFERCTICVQLTDADRQALKDALYQKYDTALHVKDIIPKLDPASVVVKILTDIDRKMVIEKNNPNGATVADVLALAMPKELPDNRQHFAR